MILEIVSIFIHSTSILLELSKNKHPEKKIELTIKYLDGNDILYSLLDEAKLAHDELENFVIASYVADPTCHGIGKVNIDVVGAQENVIRQTILMLTYFANYVSHLNSQFESINIDKIDNLSLPQDRKRNILDLARSHKDFCYHAKCIDVNIEEIRKMTGDKDFGKQFQNCIENFNSSIVECKKSADKIIFNLAPLLCDAQHNIKKYLRDA